MRNIMDSVVCRNPQSPLYGKNFSGKTCLMDASNCCQMKRNTNFTNGDFGEFGDCAVCGDWLPLNNNNLCYSCEEVNKKPKNYSYCLGCGQTIERKNPADVYCGDCLASLNEGRCLSCGNITDKIVDIHGQCENCSTDL